jgi:hypothetical protein
MKRTTIYWFTMAGVLLAATAMAHTPAKVPPRFESVTMSGEIIDPQCYFTHDSRGMDHVECATKCAKGGQGLSFLDAASGIAYPLIAKAHGGNQNDGLLPHIGKPVQVKGVVYRKAGNSVLLIQSVAASPAKAK